MNSVAVKENLVKQVVWFALNVFSTRFFYQAANSFADVQIPNRLLTVNFIGDGPLKRIEILTRKIGGKDKN
jgi:hypothetical protein